MKIKNAFQWHRQQSAIPGPIEIPAGAPVEYTAGVYWVEPSFFPKDSIQQHDALHYGCRVDPDNVDQPCTKV